MWGSQNSGYRTKLFFVPHKLLDSRRGGATRGTLVQKMSYCPFCLHWRMSISPTWTVMTILKYLKNLYANPWMSVPFFWLNDCHVHCRKKKNKTCETPKNSMGQKQAIIIKNSCWEASAVYFSRQHTKNVCPAAWWWFPLTKNEVTIYPKLSQWDKL